MKIGNHVIGYDQPIFVIAEIGINHNGSVEIAKRLIDVAISAGCDAVKFQKRTVPVVYAPSANYDPGSLTKPRQVHKDILRNAVTRGVLSAEAMERLEKSDFENSTNGDLKWALEFTDHEYDEINTYCLAKRILWFASPWDENSAYFLERYNPPCYKIASASLTDDNLLRYIRSKNRPIILSTGMSDLHMVRHAVEVLGLNELALLHCTSVYPQTLDAGERIFKMINLRCLETLKNEFPIPIGFSSHDSGIVPTFAAAAMGACIIEKHITLERSMWGSDQAGSIEPEELRTLCRWIREFEIAKGDGVIKIYPEEFEVMKKLRRKG